MSVCGETLSAITGMEEACATARARVEDLVAEADDLRRCLSSVITQRDEARAEVQDYREQLRKLPDANRVASQDAFRRGAKAMREACAREAAVCANHRGEELDAILSAMPVPEES